MIGNLLRAGVLLSAAVVVFGGIIYLVRHGLQPTDFRVFRGEAAALRTLPAILSGALHFHGKSVIQLGLLLLIATPVTRVAFSAVAFAIERDRLYVVLTLIVLAVLLYSLLGSVRVRNCAELCPNCPTSSFISKRWSRVSWDKRSNGSVLSVRPCCALLAAARVRRR